MFFKVFMLLIFGLWCTASLAGAGEGITEAFVYFMFAAFLAIAMILSATFGSPKGEAGQAALANFKKKISSYDNAAKSLFLVTCFPPTCVYLVVSIMNQLVRRIGLPMSVKTVKSGPGSGILTAAASAQLTNFKTWNHGKVSAASERSERSCVHCDRPSGSEGGAASIKPRAAESQAQHKGGGWGWGGLPPSTTQVISTPKKSQKLSHPTSS